MGVMAFGRLRILAARVRQLEGKGEMQRPPSGLGKHCTANGPAETLFTGGAVRDLGRVVSRRIRVDDRRWMCILERESEGGSSGSLQGGVQGRMRIL